MNWLALINTLIPVAASNSHRQIQLLTEQQALVDAGLDSLDILILVSYVGELYQIPESVLKTWRPQSVQEIAEFANEHGQRHWDSLAAAQTWLAEIAPTQDTD